MIQPRLGENTEERGNIPRVLQKCKFEPLFSPTVFYAAHRRKRREEERDRLCNKIARILVYAARLSSYCRKPRYGSRACGKDSHSRAGEFWV